MKLVWVKAGGLVPINLGGRIRSYHILRELARKHEVTLFTFYAADPDDTHHELKRILARVECIPLELPAPRSLAEVISYLRNLFSPRPYTIGKFCRPEVARAFRELLRREKYDCLICDFVIAGGVVPWEFPCTKLLFTHNIEALIWQRHYQVARNPLWKAVSWREYRAMAKVERLYLERADHVLTVSETDRHFFARFINPNKITVIPTGVDVDYFRPSPEEATEPGKLVFTGAMDWMPNEDAVLYFVDEILPRIHRQMPEATFWVVGRRPTPRVQELAARDPRVRVTGQVDDVRPYVLQGSVFVVPLLVGSGTRLKIFEAMAMGKAIVSTSVGAEGLPVRHGENIFLADEPEEFARSAVSLLNDPAARREMGKAARKLVQEKYSWASVAADFDSVLETVKVSAVRDLL